METVAYAVRTAEMNRKHQRAFDISHVPLGQLHDWLISFGVEMKAMGFNVDEALGKIVIKARGNAVYLVFTYGN